MDIKWTLSLNDANSILVLLGKLPYEQVWQLIADLRRQTEDCVNAPEPPPKAPPV